MVQTTPQELIEMLIAEGQFKVAERLCVSHEMSLDLVLAAQWSASDHGQQAQRDFLDQAADQDWVLRECVDCIPATSAAQRDLLLYGKAKTGMDWMDRCVASLTIRASHHSLAAA